MKLIKLLHFRLELSALLTEVLAIFFYNNIGNFATCTMARSQLCRRIEEEKNLREGAVSNGYALFSALEKFVEQARSILDSNANSCCVIL